MNKVTLSKYVEMKNIATAVGNALQDLNDRCKFENKLIRMTNMYCLSLDHHFLVIWPGGQEDLLKK